MKVVLLAVVLWILLPHTNVYAIPAECIEAERIQCSSGAFTPISTSVSSAEIPTAFTSDPWLLPTPLWARGKAKFYARDLMEKVASHRGLSLEGFVDGVALMSPTDLGTTVWLKYPGKDWEGPFRVVDCSGKNDLIGMPSSAIRLVEVGWKTAVRWKITATGTLEGVEVSKIPPGSLEGTPIDYYSWWLSMITD